MELASHVVRLNLLGPGRLRLNTVPVTPSGWGSSPCWVLFQFQLQGLEMARE